LVKLKVVSDSSCVSTAGEVGNRPLLKHVDEVHAACSINAETSQQAGFLGKAHHFSKLMQ
jgi:hypothetical protein